MSAQLCHQLCALCEACMQVVKVGIGPGSVCTTRKLTGVGYPQLSAVIECADAAHGMRGMVISDGGCTQPGDIAKAFGGGADFVMLGQCRPPGPAPWRAAQVACLLDTTNPRASC